MQRNFMTTSGNNIPKSKIVDTSLMSIPSSALSSSVPESSNKHSHYNHQGAKTGIEHMCINKEAKCHNQHAGGKFWFSI